MAAQVVSGIGFLGAGTIIFQKNVVRGLTTAAGLWVTAAIGLACGTGMYVAAGVSTLMVLLGLEILNAFLPKMGTSTMTISFVAPTRESVRKVLSQIKHDGMELYSYELKQSRNEMGVIYYANIELKFKRSKTKTENLLSYMDEFQDVIIANIE